MIGAATDPASLLADRWRFGYRVQIRAGAVLFDESADDAVAAGEALGGGLTAQDSGFEDIALDGVSSLAQVPGDLSDPRLGEQVVFGAEITA